MVSVGAFTLIYAYLMAERVAIEVRRRERLWTRT
jgi:hypothetical protein